MTVEHLHTVPSWTTRPGFCHRQARVFFQRHGLDWMDFVKNGIDEERLVATGDALALRVVEHARSVSNGK